MINNGEHELVAEAPSWRKYAAALLPAAGILLGALQLVVADGQVSGTETGQLIVLVAGLVGTYLLPIFRGLSWAGIAKTGFAVLAAVGTLIVPLVNGFSATSLIMFLIAVVNAVATEIGVNMRQDAPEPRPLV